MTAAPIATSECKVRFSFWPTSLSGRRFTPVTPVEATALCARPLVRGERHQRRVLTHDEPGKRHHPLLPVKNAATSSHDLFTNTRWPSVSVAPV